LKQKCDEPLSNVAFNFDLRRYSMDAIASLCAGITEYLLHHPDVIQDPMDSGERQGLTLVHIFAQPESFLSLKPAKHPNLWDKKCSR
jgi:hypothetical protein